MARKKEAREPMKTTLYLDADLHARFRMAALEQRISMTKLIESLMREYLEKRKGRTR